MALYHGPASRLSAGRTRKAVVDLIINTFRRWGYGLVAEDIPSMQKAPSSNSRTTKKKKEKKNKLQLRRQNDFKRNLLSSQKIRDGVLSWTVWFSGTCYKDLAMTN